MSGRGKGKSSKKAVSRSAKAGLQFPVGRIARCDYLCVTFYEPSRFEHESCDSVFPRDEWTKIRPFDEIISYHITRTRWPTKLFPSAQKQIPQGWQIRHPRWRRRPGLLGRGFGILSGWSSRTRRERFQRQQKVQNRTETHPIGHPQRRGIVQVVGHGHDRFWRRLAEHPLGLVAEEGQEVWLCLPRILNFRVARARSHREQHNNKQTKNSGEYLHQPIVLSI